MRVRVGRKGGELRTGGGKKTKMKKSMSREVNKERKLRQPGDKKPEETAGKRSHFGQNIKRYEMKKLPERCRGSPRHGTTWLARASSVRPQSEGQPGGK